MRMGIPMGIIAIYLGVHFFSGHSVVIAGDGREWDRVVGENGNEMLDWEWDGNGNDSMGMGGNGNNNSHSRTPVLGIHGVRFGLALGLDLGLRLETAGTGNHVFRIPAAGTVYTS